MIQSTGQDFQKQIGDTFLLLIMLQLSKSQWKVDLKVDHLVRARIMANLGENEILAQFCQLFSLFARFALFTAKNHDVQIQFLAEESERGRLTVLNVETIYILTTKQNSSARTQIL